MVIKKAEFLKSASSVTTCEDFSLPEIAVVGRSNVGKSSFINCLANNYKLARTSSVPGRTTLINYFKFNDEFILVDLPGYGYAKASKQSQERWSKVIDYYFENTKQLKMVILLVDIRIEPTNHDLMMLDYLTHFGIPVTVIATKYDKIKKSEKQRNINRIAAKLKVGEGNIFVISNETRYGKEQVIDRLYQFIGGNNEDLGA